MGNSISGYVKHGHADKRNPSPEYTSWCHIIQRCENVKSSRYKNYGAKGITVCRRWRESFQAFLDDLGPRPKGTSLGRYCDLAMYEPDGCCWMTQDEQGLARRNKNALLKWAAAL